MAKDDKFVQRVITLFNDLELVAPAQMWIVKDINSLHLYVSTSIINLIGGTNNNIIGNKRIAGAFSEDIITKIIHEEDHIVINELRSIYALKVYPIKDSRLFPCICIKQPLINLETNNIVGILCQLIEISITDLSQQILELYVKNDNNKLHTNIDLTKREKQIIFFFMHNLSSQQIAEIISRIENKNLTKSTVDSIIIDKLYLKFNVHNRSALTNKLKQLGYTSLIPESLLVENSIKLNKILTY